MGQIEFTFDSNEIPEEGCMLVEAMGKKGKMIAACKEEGKTKIFPIGEED